MRAVVLATLATLVGFALAATPANAQNAWLASKMIEGMCGAKAAPGASVDRLAERLNLTDGQKGTLKDLKDAAAASAASTRTALCDVKPDLTTAPSRLARSWAVRWSLKAPDLITPEPTEPLRRGPGADRHSTRNRNFASCCLQS